MVITLDHHRPAHQVLKNPIMDCGFGEPIIGCSNCMKLWPKVWIFELQLCTDLNETWYSNNFSICDFNLWVENFGQWLHRVNVNSGISDIGTWFFRLALSRKLLSLHYTIRPGKVDSLFPITTWSTKTLLPQPSLLSFQCATPSCLHVIILNASFLLWFSVVLVG